MRVAVLLSLAVLALVPPGVLGDMVAEPVVDGQKYADHLQNEMVQGCSARTDISVFLDNLKRVNIFGIAADDIIYNMYEGTKPLKDPWSDWSSLKTAVASRPVATQHADGRVVVFARGQDKQLWVAEQPRTAGTDWSAWSKLGGKLSAQVHAYLNDRGFIEVFGRDDEGYMVHTRQTEKDSLTFSKVAYTEPKLKILDVPTVATLYEKKDQPANETALIVVDAEGHLTYFLYDREYELTLQHVDKSQRVRGQPNVIADKLGQLMVSVNSENGSPLYRRQQLPGTQFIMTDWYDLKFLLIDPDWVPSLSVRRDGSIVVIIVGFDGNVYERMLQVENTWTSWRAIPRKDPTQALNSRAYSVVDSAGNIRVFGYGLDGNVYTTFYPIDGDSPEDWAEWKSIGLLS